MLSMTKKNRILLFKSKHKTVVNRNLKTPRN